MKIVAYTIPGCFYCEKLKELFERAGVECDMIVLETDQDQEKFKEDFPSAKGGGYPYVLIDDKHVGGLVETAKLFLDKRLVSSKKNG